MNDTTATNAMTVPSMMIAMTTPVITYTGSGPLSMLSLLIRVDAAPLFVALINIEISIGIEVILSSSEASSGIEASIEDIEVIPLSASDELEEAVISIVVVLATKFLVSTELVQAIP